MSRVFSRASRRAMVRVRFWEWSEKRVDSDREFAWPAPDGGFGARPPVNALVEVMSTSLAHNAVLRVGGPLRRRGAPVQ